MNDGAWKIASGRLCVACLQEMAAEYIIEPAFHGGYAARAVAASALRRAARHPAI